jgi:nitrate reductase assembly molybdenum cofactor insertion protein NarJ
MNTQLIRDAAEWRLISLLLERPGADWRQHLTALAGEVSDTTLQAAANAADENPALYDTTFGPGGPAAPREVSYRHSLMPGQMLDEIVAFYQAFAYRPTIPEPPDHIAVMTGFIAYLRLKEAFGSGEQATITAKAARDFIENHLTAIAEPLAKSLEHSGIAHLAVASTALLRLVGPARATAPTAGAIPACETACGCLGAEPEY